MPTTNNTILKQQIDYYRTRASEYDEWFLRKGKYDRGLRLNTLWFAEVEEVKKELKQFNPKGNVLELACGTGWWTEELTTYADHITAVDVAPEVIEINRGKVQNKKVTYTQADIFNWKPDSKYDVVFFSFWISHIPPERFASFWNFVRSALTPNGRVFFLDNLKSATQKETDYQATTSIRTVKSGEQFTIVKIFYKPKELEHRLENLGWQVTVKHTANYFLYGFGSVKPNM